jgi:hypothetical protein
MKIVQLNCTINIINAFVGLPSRFYSSSLDGWMGTTLNYPTLPTSDIADQPIGALEGLRVLDIATFVAAPFCGTILADFGLKSSKSSSRTEVIFYAGSARLLSAATASSG